MSFVKLIFEDFMNNKQQGGNHQGISLGKTLLSHSSFNTILINFKANSNWPIIEH